MSEEERKLYKESSRMVRIRFRRMGLKGQPSYRIVVTDQRSPRDGRFIEIIGFHNPRTEPATDTIKEERALHWLNVGAQPSDAVKRVLQRTGTWARFERLRKGESLETLVAEAQAQFAEAEVSPKTRYPAPAAGQSKWKAAERAAAAAASAAEAAEPEAAAESDGDLVDAIEADVKKVAETVEGAVEAAKEIVEDVVEAVENAVEKVVDAVEDAVEEATGDKE